MFDFSKNPSHLALLSRYVAESCCIHLGEEKRYLFEARLGTIISESGARDIPEFIAKAKADAAQTVADLAKAKAEFLANMRSTKTILKQAWSTVSQTYPGYKVMFTNDTVAPAVDTGDVFNVPGSTYTVGKNGYYKLNANIKVGVTITGIQPGGGILNPVMISGPNFTGKIYIKDETGAILKQSDFVLTIVPAFSVNAERKTRRPILPKPFIPILTFDIGYF